MGIRSKSMKSKTNDYPDEKRQDGRKRGRKEGSKEGRKDGRKEKGMLEGMTVRNKKARTATMPQRSTMYTSPLALFVITL